jgi:hypothetical protein
MKKLLLVLMVLFVSVNLMACRKDKEEVVAVDVTEYVTAFHNENGIGWNWSEVDFDNYNWFQRNLLFKKPTQFTIEIFVHGKEHRIEFRNKETEELIGFADFKFD